MPAFLLTKNDTVDLETIVFTLDGLDSENEGVPVFTKEEFAKEWLAGSEDESNYDVVMLEDLPFMFWCLEICREGIGHLILDPDRATQSAGKGQDTINLAGHLAWSATQLLSSHQRAA